MFLRTRGCIVCLQEGVLFVNRKVYYLSIGRSIVCHGKVYCLSTGRCIICKQEGVLFVYRKVYCLSAGRCIVCLQEGVLFVKRTLFCLSTAGVANLWPTGQMWPSSIKIMALFKF